MSGVTSLNTKVGAVGLTSGNPLIGVGSSGNNVVVTATNTGITAITVSAQSPPDPLTTGAINVVAGSGMTIATDSLANTLTFTSSGAGGSSIANANGNTVACVAGGINLTTTANAGDGSIIMDTTTASGAGNIVGESGGYLGLGTVGGGIALVSNTSQITMDVNGLGQPVSGGTNFPTGTAGVISLATSATNPGQVTIGGSQVNTGLYVSNTALTFNGSAVGAGGGNWSYKGVFVATSGTAYAINDVVFDTVNTTQTYVCILAYTTGASAVAPSANTTNWLLFATNAPPTSVVVGAGTPATGALTLAGGVTQSGSTFTVASPTSVVVGAGTPVTGALTFAGGVTQSGSTFTFSGSGGGGNWSYKGVFVATSGTAYALNDVVFDTVNTTETYVCILAYTTGASAVAPSANTTNWKLFAINSASASGSSITAGGATVACDNPASSGSITLTTNSSGTAGDLTIDTSAGQAGVITIKGAGDILIDATTSTGGGVRINTATTSSIFEDTNTTGVAGQIKFTSTDATNPAELTVGGTVNNTGLYVSNTALTFNGTAVNGNWSYKGVFVATAGTSYALNEVVFDTVNTAETYICILAYTIGAVGPPSVNTTNWLLFATNAPVASASSISQAGGSVSVGSSGFVNITSAQGGFVEVLTDAGQAIMCQGSQTKLSSQGTQPGTLTVGGTPASTGLYVSNTDLIFNGTAVGYGNWRYEGTFSVIPGTTYALNDVVFSSINPTQTFICKLAYTTTGPTPADPTADSTHWLLFATNFTPSLNNMRLPGITGQNKWTSGSYYSPGDVVISTSPPYNFFLCYVELPAQAITTDPATDVAGGSSPGQGQYWQLLASRAFKTTTGASPGTFYGSLTLTGTAIVDTDTTTGTVTIDAGGGSSITNNGGFVTVGNSGQIDIQTVVSQPLTVNAGNVSINTTSTNPGSITIGGAKPSGYLGLYVTNTVASVGDYPVVTFTGAWVSGRSYIPGNIAIVASPGGSYVCITAVTGTASPNTDPTNWTHLV